MPDKRLGVRFTLDGGGITLDQPRYAQSIVVAGGEFGRSARSQYAPGPGDGNFDMLARKDDEEELGNSCSLYATILEKLFLLTATTRLDLSSSVRELGRGFASPYLQRRPGPVARYSLPRDDTPRLLSLP